LTAYADVHANAEAEFLGLGWLLLRYDPSREDWARALRNMAQQIIWARESVRSAKGVYSSDLAVVCALEDPELESVLSLPWNWDKWRENGDATVYYRGSIGGGERVVFAAASARMGLPSAAVLAMKMICAFQPRYIVDVGIAASFVGRANFGDVLAADLSWDYGSGKYARVEGAGAFLQGPNQYQLNADLRGRIGELAREDSLLQEVYKRWRGDRPETQLRIVVGPMASGAAVVADEARAKEISLQHGKLLGIDMEAYAVFDAAAESPMPRPAAFSLKGVTDFADSKKDDRFRQYAAYTSAECLRLLAERYLG
jgi:nucleoside phosphorylase